MIKGSALFRIDVEHRYQPASLVRHGDNDLGARAAVAGDVSRKQVHVRHDHGLPRGSGGPAHAAPEFNLQTTQRSLVRPDAEESTRLDPAINTRPNICETVMQQAAHRR